MSDIEPESDSEAKEQSEDEFPVAGSSLGQDMNPDDDPRWSFARSQEAEGEAGRIAVDIEGRKFQSWPRTNGNKGTSATHLDPDVMGGRFSFGPVADAERDGPVVTRCVGGSGGAPADDFYRRTTGGLSNNWDKLSAPVRDVDADDMAHMALTQLHEGHRLQAALLLQDMYRSQEILHSQDLGLQQVENLIRQVRVRDESAD